MNEQFLQKLRSQHTEKRNQVSELLVRYQNEGIEPFIAKLEECRTNLTKAEADLKSVCALVGIPLDGFPDVPAGFGSSPADGQTKPQGTGDRKNIPNEQVQEAISKVLSAETTSFTLKELMMKTSFSRQQVGKAAKVLVEQGKVTETTETSSKSPGLPPKLYTWKS